jgi:hypothetical protein
MATVVDVPLQFSYGPSRIVGAAVYDPEAQVVHNRSFQDLHRAEALNIVELSISNDIIIDLSRDGTIRALEILGHRNGWDVRALPKGYENAKVGSARFCISHLHDVHTQDLVHWYTDESRTHLIATVLQDASFDDAIKIAPNISILRKNERFSGVAVWDL